MACHSGTIKANFPTRVSFQVTSKIDSRRILGEQGAEHLLGQGDMVDMASGGRVMRVHGPFVSDEEIERVTGFLKEKAPSMWTLMTSILMIQVMPNREQWVRRCVSTGRGHCVA